MADILIFDPNSTPVVGRVLGVLASVNTTDYAARADVLISPALPSGTPSDWKVVSGKVVAMDATDLAALASASAATLAAKKAATELQSKADATGAVDDFYEEGRLIRALAEVMMDEINILRQQPTTVLAVRTLAQLKTAIKAKLAAQADTSP